MKMHGLQTRHSAAELRQATQCRQQVGRYFHGDEFHLNDRPATLVKEAPDLDAIPKVLTCRRNPNW